MIVLHLKLIFYLVWLRDRIVFHNFSLCKQLSPTLNAMTNSKLCQRVEGWGYEWCRKKQIDIILKKIPADLGRVICAHIYRLKKCETNTLFK